MWQSKYRAGLFNPECGQPAYLMKDESVAQGCGHLGGTITGVIIGGVVGVMVWQAMFRHKATSDMIDVVVSLIVFAIILFICRMLGGFFQKRAYQTYQLDIKARMDSGLTHAQAIAQEQDLANSRRQADAMSSAGTSIGAAIFASQ